MKTVRAILNAIRIIVFIVFTLICLQYFLSRHYKFPEPSPFTGGKIYNPYDNLTGNWLKANFHAHAHAWGGLTNGHQDAPTILAEYQKMHYDVATISDYEKHNPQGWYGTSDPLHVYEHGYSIKKVHQLVFGDQDIIYYDVVLIQSIDNKQYILEKEKETAPLVAMAHPLMRNAYSKSEMEKLTGYDMMEVMNNWRNSEKYWDWALSAGRLSWVIGDDDCHNILLPNETGISWTMVNSPGRSAAEIITSMKEGRNYVVNGNGGVNDHYLKSVSVEGMTIHIQTDGAGDFRLTGQNGVLRKEAKSTDSISYSFTPEDHYIRAVIHFPKTTMYLNPLVRFDGIHKPGNPILAQYDSLKTFLLRFGISLLWLIGSLVILAGRVKKIFGLNRKR
jgi:hypothetical protein